MSKHLLTDFVSVERVGEYRRMLFMRKPLCGGTVYELYRKEGYPSMECYTESGERIRTCTCGNSLHDTYHAGMTFNVYDLAQDMPTESDA